MKTIIKQKAKDAWTDIKVFLLGEELIPVWVFPVLFFAGLFIGLVLWES